MSTVLRQRRFFVTKVFEISNKSLKVKVSNLLGSINEEFNFEDIGCKYVLKNMLPWKTAIPTALFIIGFIITVVDRIIGDSKSIEDIMFYTVLIIVLGTLTLLNRRNTTSIFVHNIKLLDLYTKSPSNTEVTEFLKLLKSRQKEYFFDRYINSDLNQSFEQISSTLNWLYNADFIDQDEFNNLKEYHLKRLNDNESQIKFNFSNN